jgi:hypothetical protein
MKAQFYATVILSAVSSKALGDKLQGLVSYVQDRTAVSKDLGALSALSWVALERLVTPDFPANYLKSGRTVRNAVLCLPSPGQLGRHMSLTGTEDCSG